MDPQLQADLQRLRAAHYSDDQLRAYAADWYQRHGTGPSTPVAAPADATDTSNPAAPTEVNPGNLLASAVQGATLGYAGREGWIDPTKAAAFANDHSVVDAGAKAAGGSVIPAALTFAFPELASALGITAMGGVEGGVAGSSQGKDAATRVKNAAVGAAVGAPAALATSAASQGIFDHILSPLAQKVFPRLAANRAIGTAVDNALTPAEAGRVQARMNDVNAIAPGGSSAMTAAVPEMGIEDSRFKDMLKGVGADPDAAKGAEAQLMQQYSILKNGRDALGTQMNQLQGRIPGSLELRDALTKARSALGPNGVPMAGQLPPGSGGPQVGVDVQDARNTLSALRMELASEQDAVRPNGVRVRALSDAKNALQDVIYKYAAQPGAQGPAVDLAKLDKQYAQLWDESRSVDRLLPYVQRSAGSYNANDAFGVKPGSLGGSLPSSTTGVMHAAATSAVTPNMRPAVAAAVPRTLMDPDLDISELLRMMPSTPRVRPAIRAGISASLPPALQGLFFPPKAGQ